MDNVDNKEGSNPHKYRKVEGQQKWGGQQKMIINVKMDNRASLQEKKI